MSRPHAVTLGSETLLASSRLSGARVGVTLDSGTTLWRRARADGSYASANDPRVLVGLGPTAKPSRVRVVWPDGETEDIASVAIDRYTTVTQGARK
mgnify:CR=1 FL=1